MSIFEVGGGPGLVADDPFGRAEKIYSDRFLMASLKVRAGQVGGCDLQAIEQQAGGFISVVRNIQVRRNSRASHALSATRGKCPTPVRHVRPVVATSRLVPQGKLDTVPHTQPVVDGSKAVLEDVLGGPNFAGDVPVIEALGDEGDDAVFPFSR
jgi:hypothetical protein